MKAELGDFVILGATRAKQLKNTVEEIGKGPLEDWVVERLDKIWKRVENDAPQDNFSTSQKLVASGGLE